MKATMYTIRVTVSLELAHVAARDAVENFAIQVRDRKAYMKRSCMFELFQYVEGDDYTGSATIRMRSWIVVSR